MQHIIDAAVKAEAEYLKTPLAGPVLAASYWAAALVGIKAALPSDTATMHELLTEAGAWPADMDPREYRYRATLQFMRITKAWRAGR